MISPAPIVMPPQIGAGLLPPVSDTRITSVGTAISANSGQVLLAGGQPQVVQQDLCQPHSKRAGSGDEEPKQPTARMAAAKSSASLNTDVTLLAISFYHRDLEPASRSHRADRRA